MENICRKIKKLRTSLGLTQEQLANAIGVDKQSIYRYEAGKSLPSTFELVRLSTFFDVSCDYLLGLIGYEEQLKEEKYKVFNNGQYNQVYQKYLNSRNIKHIDETKNYFWIKTDGTVVGGQTEWCGWKDGNHNIEIRELRFVKPIEAFKECTLYSQKPMVVTTEEEAFIFRLFCGHAIVQEDICKKYLPEFTEPYYKTRSELHEILDL